MDILAQNEDLGFSLPEALQNQGAFQQRSGGFLSPGLARAGNIGQQALRGFGIPMDVSGQFGFAARRGGITGVGETGDVGQRTEALLTRAIVDGLSTGLRGNELINFVSRIAAGIDEFRTTGMSFDETAFVKMQSRFAREGLGPTIGSNMAFGIAQSARQVGLAGPAPGDIGGIQMLRSLGGLRGGGTNSAALEAAELNLQTGRFAEGGPAQLMRDFLSMGGKDPAAQRRMLRFQLLKKGIRVGGDAFQVFAKRMQGVPLSGKFEKDAYEQLTQDLQVDAKSGESQSQAMARAVLEGGGIPGRARDVMNRLPPGSPDERDKSPLARSAANLNKQLTDIGAKMADSAQNLADAKTAFDTALIKFKKPLETMTGHLKTAADEMEKIADKMSKAQSKIKPGGF